ncbi:MAG: thioredoxin [Chitinophagales bacterium]|nr:thioredoxin [Chitinophagales bacterium]
MPLKVTTKNFKTAVLGYEGPVVVDVWADWCGPCKMLAPQFAAAADELEGKARFVKVDADKNQKILKKYKIMGLPTLLFFKNGELVDQSTGVISKSAILKKVKPLLSEEDQKSMKAGFNWKFWK